MYTKLTISHKELSMKIVADVMSEHALCNILPLTSVVQDKDTHDRRVEPGAEITCFDINPQQLLQIWAGLRKALHIHCAWISAGDYDGCICNWPVYLKVCQALYRQPLLCSEYN